jgi:transposase
MLIATSLKVWLSATPTDMRKAIDGLSFLVVDAMQLAPNSGELFIFYNRQFNKLKILYWDKNGFCLWYKRLEKHRFKLPTNPTSPLQITATQLRWLLDGLDFMNMKETKFLDQSIFF